MTTTPDPVRRAETAPVRTTADGVVTDLMWPPVALVVDPDGRQGTVSDRRADSGHLKILVNYPPAPDGLPRPTTWWPATELQLDPAWPRLGDRVTDGHRIGTTIKDIDGGHGRVYEVLWDDGHRWPVKAFDLR